MVVSLRGDAFCACVTSVWPRSADAQPSCRNGPLFFSSCLLRPFAFAYMGADADSGHGDCPAAVPGVRPRIPVHGLGCIQIPSMIDDSCALVG